MQASALLRAVPGLAAQFKEVPAPYWRFHGQSGKVRVDCPCGNRPVFGIGFKACRDNAPCPHRCERTFLFSGKRVLVAGGPRAA